MWGGVGNPYAWPIARALEHPEGLLGDSSAPSVFPVEGRRRIEATDGARSPLAP